MAHKLVRALAGTVLLVPLLTVVAVLAPPTAPAGAIGDVNLLFTNPGTTPVYGGNEVVALEAGNINFVGNCSAGEGGRLTGGIKDTFQPWADLYIVPSGQTYTNNTALVDVAGSANSLHGGLAGSFLYEPLGATAPTGKIPTGRYGVVVDECQNGVFDTGEDTYVDDAFRVSVVGYVPHFNPELSAFVDTKLAAATQSDHLAQVDQLLALKEYYDKANEAIGAVTAISSEGFAVFAINQAVGAAVAGSPYSVLKDRAQELARETVAQYRTKIKRLAADPPNPDYSNFALPAATGAWMNERSRPLSRSYQAYVSQLDALQALSGAILDAVERYQGAEAAGDQAWALRHARSIMAMTSLYEARVAALSASIDAVKGAVAGVYADDGYDFANGIPQVRNVLSDLDRADLGSYSTFANTGADEASARAIADAYQDVTAGPNLNTPASWNAVLDRAKADVVGFGATMADLRGMAGDLEAELEGVLGAGALDPTLAVTLTGAPRAGATVQLGLSGLPAGSSVSWDLDGDGTAGDANGATHAWQVTGDATVGAPLVVSATVSGAGYQGTATTVITVVAGGNRAPVVSAAEKSQRELAPGESTTFATGATDPDGDPLTYEWLVDGQTVAGQTAASFTLTSTTADFGGRYVEVLVGDGQALTREAWFARIVTPDADRDGWRASPGPDCLDAPDGSTAIPSQVNPNAAEITGNGVDDDCSDRTPDDGSGSSGYVYVYGMPSKTVGDIVQPGGGEIGWSHPQRYSGQTFRLTVDWGDGSAPTVSTVAGTTYEATQFPTPRHRYGQQRYSTVVEFCVEQVATGQTFCTSLNFAILNDRPMVNAADLRTWGPQELVSLDYGSGVSGGWEALDPEGRQVVTTGNPNNLVILPSNDELPGGYGRAAMSQQMISGGDDDLIGILFGYQPGEAATASGDFVGVSWSNDSAIAPFGFFDVCNDAPQSGSPPVADSFHAFRQRGVANLYETAGEFVMNVPYDPSDDAATGEGPQKASCSDDQGRELLASVPPSSTLEGRAVWRYRADRQSYRSFQNVDPYLIEYDYQPDSLTVWIDGVEQFVARPSDPSEPFPPGAPALLTQSQAGAIVSATAPEETFAFTQGKGGEFSTEAADGITMPMHDGAEDTHLVRIDWGDGTATTEGTRTTDPARGYGWFELSGDHVYDRSGTFRGKVCATDQFDLRMCFPFTAEVAGVGPVVDAGLDRPTGGTVTLDDMSFQDPGLSDTHTATIDWDIDDAEAPEPVDPAGLDEVRGGGLVSGTHTYATDGERTVELCVTDQDGQTGCDERVLDVVAENAPPAAQVTGGPTLPEGSSGEVSVGFTDANPDDTHTVTDDWGDGSAPAPVAIQDGGDFGSGTATHVYRDDGSFTATFEVCDQDDDCDTATTTVTVSNAAPTVDAQATDTDGTATLGGTYADAGADDTHTATVDWGDGTTPQPVTLTPTAGGGSGTLDATHTYEATGTYDVVVCVTDDDAAEGCDGLELTVTAVTGEAPVVTTEALPDAVEGDTASLTAAFTDGDTGDTHTATVDWGDGTSGPGTVTGDTVAASHRYRDDDAGTPLTVKVTVCDQARRCGTEATTIAVANATPTVDAGRDRTIGPAVSLDDSTFADLGADDTHTATVDWGDGTGVQEAVTTGDSAAASVQATHTYASAGTRTVTVCVADDEGAEGCDTSVLVVAPSPITVTVAPTISGDEGSPITVPFTFADPDGGAHTAIVRWADGSPATTVTLVDGGTGGSGSATHTYVDEGSFGATVEVCDADTCATATSTIAVANVAPTVTAPVGTATDGTLTVSAPFTDPGTADAHTATVDWGDGTSGPGTVAGTTVTGSHAYAAAGTYEVEVCVADDRAATGCAIAELTVDDPPNAPPVVELALPTGLAEGTAFTLSGSFADPDVGDAWTLEVDWGDGTTTDGVDLAAPGAFATPHTYADDGSYTITAEVLDGAGSDDATVFGVSVANVAPTAAVTPTIDGLRLDLSIALTDPGIGDELSATVDWGDGTVEDVTPAAPRAEARAATSHTYGTAGAYDIEVCARDTDGGRSCTARSVTVTSTTTTTPGSTTSTTPASSSTTAPVTPSTGPSPTAPGRPTPSGPGTGGTGVGGRPTTGTLPRTGTDHRTPVRWALILLGVGGALVVVRRRRLAAVGGTT